MTKPVISVEHLTKQYDLGVIGTGTLSRDLNRWWARVRKQPDPYTRIGQKDAFARIGESILALDDVSFTVQQGEALGIIGRNGAGKSTLLKILSRVTAPTSGVVKVRGRIGSLLEVGTGFHPELTGRENVYLNGAILGMRKEEVTRKFDEIVDFSGVEKFIDTPVKRYSSGMYVRLAFAVAAHLDPEILIVDEVLAVGDAEFQKKCLGKMGDVAGEGRTVLFVSHNMAAIQQLCRRGFLLEQGKVVSEGLVEEVLTAYLSKRTQNNSKYIANYYSEERPISFKLIEGVPDHEYGFLFLSDLIFRIIVVANHKISNLDLGITIKDYLNAPVFSGFTDISFNINSKEEKEILLKIDALGLVPGEYKLDISLSTGSLFSGRKTHELLQPALYFSVINDPSEKEVLQNWQKGFGNIFNEHIKADLK